MTSAQAPRLPDDDGLRRVLRSLGVAARDLLGHGGEAWVYAFSCHLVVRVLHEGQDEDSIRQRAALVDELSSGGAPFALPEVVRIGEVDGRWYTVERRLPGVPLAVELERVEGADRGDVVERYLDAVARLGDLPLGARDWFGELIGDQPLRAPTWEEYLRGRAISSLAAVEGLGGVDVDRLVDDLPPPARTGFVHLDAFAGNVLVDGGRVSAVIDFGPTCLVGDPTFDPVSAVVYLSSPGITPSARDEDVDVGMAWLRANALDGHVEPIRRWLAAFWSFAVDDVQLHAWCRCGSERSGSCSRRGSRSRICL